jgi:spore maturation protein CgeB
MGVGAFLLTREAVNLSDYNKKEFLRTFSDNEDCIRKIEYYLANEREREDIAKNGKAYVYEKFDYSDIISQIRNKF